MQLELAVNEIASNIMKYAYQQPADRPLEVEFSATERQVAVRLVHWGQSFTPRSVQPPAFDGSREHGFGLYIVDQCVDQVSYRTADGGRNCIELIKKCAPGGKEKTQMKLQVEKVDDVTLVTIPEENLDAGNAKDFKQSVMPELEASDKVIFDLTRLLFVDSSGLGAILSALRTLNSRGGDLKLCGMTKQVRVLFELVRMHRIFEIFNTRQEALRAFDVFSEDG